MASKKSLLLQKEDGNDQENDYDSNSMIGVADADAAFVIAETK
jgi:hypothetical protein